MGRFTYYNRVGTGERRHCTVQKNLRRRGGTYSKTMPFRSWQTALDLLKPQLLSEIAVQLQRTLAGPTSDIHRPIFQNNEGESISLETLDTIVNCAAYDAGIEHAERVDARYLQPSYRIH